MKKTYINPDMKIARFDDVIGTSNVFASGNVNDASITLGEIESKMVKNFEDLKFTF
jgi:hypothetical protein